MKNYLKNLGVFGFIAVLFLFIGLALPPTPVAKQGMEFAKIKKDSLLMNVKSPRIIFVGGSSLSLGLNSQMIKDSLHMNPINCGLNAGLGLLYMLDNVLPFIKKGDIIVVAPEYHQYFGSLAYGGLYLASMIMNVSPSEIFNLREQQYSTIYKYFVKLSITKFDPRQYRALDDNGTGVEFCSSFNDYGDVYLDRRLKKTSFTPHTILGEFNEFVVPELLLFQEKINKRGGLCLLTYPCLQDISFEKNKDKIDNLKQELNNFIPRLYLLGTPERYMMPDSLMYDSAYHLLKEGANIRTKLLIADLKVFLNSHSTN